MTSLTVDYDDDGNNPKVRLSAPEKRQILATTKTIARVEDVIPACRDSAIQVASAVESLARAYTNLYDDDDKETEVEDGNSE